MDTILDSLTIDTTSSLMVERAWWSSLAWILGAAVLGYVVSAFFSTFLKLRRSLFLVPYVLLTGMFLYSYWQWSGLSAASLILKNWIVGLVGAALFGLFVVRNVRSQPSSPAPTGPVLVFDLLWSGLVYGGIDALFLSVLPVLATQQAFSALGWTGSWPGKILVGVIALLFSLFVTVSYHWGFAEYRKPGGIAGPTIGNGVMSLGFLLTSNPLTAVISHISMHTAGVLHGPASVMQLPPHAVSE